jgi:uncharacterized membrane protein affecting hemolysin expression
MNKHVNKLNARMLRQRRVTIALWIVLLVLIMLRVFAIA